MLIENERLPSSLGWTKQASVVTLEDILRMTEIIGNVTSLITAGPAKSTRRGNLHSGLGLQM